MAPTHVRYFVLALLALAPASAYLTRIIAASNTTIAAEFQTTDDVMGDVIAGFALGYFIFQIPGGILASARGVRGTLPVMSLCWSVCAFWSSRAASPDELWISRVAIGVFQASLVPCCAQVLTDWFPVSRRGVGSAVLGAAMQLGGVAATTLPARLLGPLGWRGTLQAFSATGAVWAIAFYFWFRNRPVEHSQVNAAERELITGDRVIDTEGAVSLSAADSGPSSWLTVTLAMAASVSIWAFLVQAVLRAYAYEFYTTWCPAFLEKGYGLDKGESATLTALPLVAFFIGSLVSGFIVDAVLVYTNNRWLSRSGMAIVGLALSALCIAAATQIGDPKRMMALQTLGAFFFPLSGTATWAAAMDLGGRRAAVLAGTMNMMGNIGAYYCPKHVGRLFKSIEFSSGNWNLVLWLFAGVNLAAALTWLFVNPRRAVLD